MAESLRPRSTILELVGLLLTLVVSGCGTTRSSDTHRTATEQLLISDAIDRAVGALQVDQLAGQAVFVDDKYLSDVLDRSYLVSSIRQHLLANACILKNEREEADFIVEARAGVVGTNRHDLLFGIPSMNLPQIFPLQGIPAAIPEVPVAKRRDQRGVAKIALFAYHRATGAPVWQSGIAQQESSLNDVWLLGAGPFRHGTVHQEKTFGSEAIRQQRERSDQYRELLAQGRTYNNPAKFSPNPSGLQEEMVLTDHQQEVADTAQSDSSTARDSATSDDQADGLATEPNLLQSDAIGSDVRGATISTLSSPNWYYSVQEQQLWPTKAIVDVPVGLTDPHDPVPLPQPIRSTPP